MYPPLGEKHPFLRQWILMQHPRAPITPFDLFWKRLSLFFYIPRACHYCPIVCIITTSQTPSAVIDLLWTDVNRAFKYKLMRTDWMIYRMCRVEPRRLTSSQVCTVTESWSINMTFDVHMLASKITLADPRGATREALPPLGVQILSFSCSFRQKNL